MKWAVEQKYFDDGSVLADLFHVDDGTQDQQETREGYDYYLDVFDNLEEAQTFYKDVEAKPT